LLENFSSMVYNASMKTKIILLVLLTIPFAFCKQGSSSKELGGGMASVKDNVSEKNVVQIASESKDHSTLVKAVQAAGLVDALANPGPFTVFAPTNAAFDQVPKSDLENLLKPENKNQLSTVLYHHVFVGNLRKDDLIQRFGNQEMIMFDGTPEKIEVKGNDIFIGGAKVLAVVPASNGVVYVIDKVLLAKQKK